MLTSTLWPGLAVFYGLAYEFRDKRLTAYLFNYLFSMLDMFMSAPLMHCALQCTEGAAGEGGGCQDGGADHSGGLDLEFPVLCSGHAAS